MQYCVIFISTTKIILVKYNTVSEENFDEITRAVYIKNDSYCVVDKQTGKFCGFISITNEDNEGEQYVYNQNN